ncbi:hypothetical protein [Chryseobacterium luteum]|uniref:Uncharacterized protein n=1 Tax=Chryseobacterium luteum TaxID=421531 RepID=A0A085ZVB9_9FLAO|nr:hypothetical protein [Chryseobacterium luteum]KFF08383.1 hypothetical protein IX38_06350 [Chryseobacterium luteum]
MKKNIELENLLGKISQLVNYKKLNDVELGMIKDFCDEMIESLSLIDKPEIFDFSDFKINRQDDVDAEYSIRVVKKETCPDNSMSGAGEIDPAIILGWHERYSEIKGMEFKYLPSIEITREIAQELFTDSATTKTKIYLGEDNCGLVFLTANESEGKYAIISNTLEKTVLNRVQYDDCRAKYNSGLKSSLDDYIRYKTKDSMANNTRRFILGRKMYENFIKACGSTANSVIAFYPVIYLENDYLQYPDDDGICVKVKHKHRLTFLMTSEHHTKEGRVAFQKESVYDRNGLCPPPDNSNC